MTGHGFRLTQMKKIVIWSPDSKKSRQEEIGYQGVPIWFRPFPTFSEQCLCSKIELEHNLIDFPKGAQISPLWPIQNALAATDNDHPERNPAQGHSYIPQRFQKKVTRKSAKISGRPTIHSTTSTTQTSTTDSTRITNEMATSSDYLMKYFNGFLAVLL